MVSKSFKDLFWEKHDLYFIDPELDATLDVRGGRAKGQLKSWAFRNYLLLTKIFNNFTLPKCLK